jgi:hypothetical protein
MSRARYHSDSYALNKERRLGRIRDRADPVLTKAYERGELSLRRYDLVSRRPATQQRRIIAAERARSAAALVAAKAVNQFLDNLRIGSPVRLQEVVSAIRSAVAHAPKAHESRLQT